MQLDPSAAVAAAICHLSRVTSPVAVSSRHPGRCGWCDWPLPELQRVVAEYQVNSREVFAFRRLSGDAQRKLVTEAQAIEEPAA